MATSKWLWMLLAWSLSSTAWAQSLRRTDSLQQLLAAARTDTARVRLLNKLASEYSNADPPKALTYARRAAKLAQASRFTAGWLRALDFEGWIYFLQGDLRKAAAQYERTLRLAQTQRDAAAVASAQYGLGTVYQGEGLFPLALDNLLSASRYFEQTGDTARQAITSLSVAHVYADMNNPAQAETSYRLAQRLLARQPQHPGHGVVLNGLGEIAMRRHQYAASVRNYQQAAQLFERTNQRVNLATTLTTLGDAQAKLGQLAAARSTLERAVTLNRQVGGFSLAQSYRSLARLALQEQRPAAAAAFVRQAQQTTDSADWREQFENCAVLAAVSKANGDYRQALAWQERGQVLNDSLLNERSRDQLTLLQYQHNTLRREQHISRQQSRIRGLEQQQRFEALRTGFLAVLVVVLAGGGWLGYRHLRLARQRDQAQAAAQAAAAAAEQLAAQARLQQVQHQLDLKNQELTSLALTLTQKGELLDDVRGQINTIARTTDAEARRQLQRLRLSIDHNARGEKEWTQFVQAFEQVHQNFFVTLQQRCPELTPYELKLAALLKLNLTSKDMAALLGISEDSVKKARYRIRRKLQLDTNTNLVEFMMRLEGGEATGENDSSGSEEKKDRHDYFVRSIA